MLTAVTFNNAIDEYLAAGTGVDMCDAGTTTAPTTTTTAAPTTTSTTAEPTHTAEPTTSATAAATTAGTPEPNLSGSGDGSEDTSVPTAAPSTTTTAPEAAPANYEEIVAENATESGSVCLTSNGEAPSTRRNYYSWSSSWSLQKCADKCDGMLAAGYGECYGFNLYNKFICTVYFEPVPVAKKNTCTTCVKRCFSATTTKPKTFAGFPAAATGRCGLSSVSSDVCGASPTSAATFVDYFNFGATFQDVMDSNQVCMAAGAAGCADNDTCATADPCQAQGFSCVLCVAADATKQNIFLAYGALDAECSAATSDIAGDVGAESCAKL